MSDTGTVIELHVVLVAMADMPEATDSWWDWLTPAERQYSFGLRDVGNHLAARAVGKVAAASAMREAWSGAPDRSSRQEWRELEVLRVAGTPPRVRLSGSTEESWARTGLPVPGVSLTHAAGYAGALAWLPGGAV